MTALDVPEEWDAVLRRASIVSVLEARIAIEAEAAALAAQHNGRWSARAARRGVEGVA
ncbi:hypothetical protein [Amycolatopsis sulphurea]|uniref:hypothetical protein n=1 Tax=Amycolatopsis sulphurea TaxID=76022 RepID=UPI001FE955CF|nr:hypothetical protein [Amycolatopsis sulphurea]